MALGVSMRECRNRRSRISSAPDPRASIEGLETRALLSTHTVTNTNHSGAGSLRQAILSANRHAGADAIRYAIASGTAAAGNKAHGILVQCAGNTIANNVISGNGKAGVFLYTAKSNRNKVVGNLIGTNAAGTAAVPNVTNGVHFQSSHTNTIGGTTSAERNVISGNKQDGVVIAGSGAAGN